MIYKDEEKNDLNQKSIDNSIEFFKKEGQNSSKTYPVNITKKTVEKNLKKHKELLTSEFFRSIIKE